MEFELCSLYSAFTSGVSHNGVRELQLGHCVRRGVSHIRIEGRGVQLCLLPQVCFSCSVSTSGMSFCGIESQKSVSHWSGVEVLLQLCHIRLRCVSPWIWICALVVMYPLKACLTLELEHFFLLWNYSRAVLQLCHIHPECFSHRGFGAVLHSLMCFSP